jgi:DNA replication protein DnaC
VATMPLLIIDDFGMRKLPHTAAEDLLEIVKRRYERFGTLLTSETTRKLEWRRGPDANRV